MKIMPQTKYVTYSEMPRVALTLTRGYLRGTRTECCSVGCTEGCNLWLYPFL